MLSEISPLVPAVVQDAYENLLDKIVTAAKFTEEAGKTEEVRTSEFQPLASHGVTLRLFPTSREHLLFSGAGEEAAQCTRQSTRAVPRA